MRRSSAPLTGCLLVAVLVAVLALRAGGAHKPSTRPASARLTAAATMRALDVCAVAGGACVGGCSLPVDSAAPTVAVRSHARTAPARSACTAARSKPCMLAVATRDEVVSPARPAPFCRDQRLGDIDREYFRRLPRTLRERSRKPRR